MIWANVDNYPHFGVSIVALLESIAQMLAVLIIIDYVCQVNECLTQLNELFLSFKLKNNHHFALVVIPSCRIDVYYFVVLLDHGFKIGVIVCKLFGF